MRVVVKRVGDEVLLRRPADRDGPRVEISVPLREVPELLSELSRAARGDGE